MRWLSYLKSATHNRLGAVYKQGPDQQAAARPSHTEINRLIHNMPYGGCYLRAFRGKRVLCFMSRVDGLGDSTS